MRARLSLQSEHHHRLLSVAQAGPPVTCPDMPVIHLQVTLSEVQHRAVSVDKNMVEATNYLGPKTQQRHLHHKNVDCPFLFQQTHLRRAQQHEAQPCSHSPALCAPEGCGCSLYRNTSLSDPETRASWVGKLLLFPSILYLTTQFRKYCRQVYPNKFFYNDL